MDDILVDDWIPTLFAENVAEFPDRGIPIGNIPLVAIPEILFIFICVDIDTLPALPIAAGLLLLILSILIELYIGFALTIAEGIADKSIDIFPDIFDIVPKNDALLSNTLVISFTTCLVKFPYVAEKEFLKSIISTIFPIFPTFNTGMEEIVGIPIAISCNIELDEMNVFFSNNAEILAVRLYIVATEGGIDTILVLLDIERLDIVATEGGIDAILVLLDIARLYILDVDADMVGKLTPMLVLPFTAVELFPDILVSAEKLIVLPENVLWFFSNIFITSVGIITLPDVVANSNDMVY